MTFTKSSVLGILDASMFGCILQWFIKGETLNHLHFIQSFNQGETKTQNRNNVMKFEIHPQNPTKRNKSVLIKWWFLLVNII
jgi:hypothetical protein